MQRGKVVLGAAALALMVGCAGAPQPAAVPAPAVEDRPVPGAEAGGTEGGAESEEKSATGTLADAEGIEGSPLVDAAGSELTLVIYFDFDSSEVHPDDRIVVEAHAQYLARDPDLEVVLEGHADERGSREYNVALGERRANGVRDMLRVLGVLDRQVGTVSYGEELPAAIGHEEVSWSRNRRVEFKYGTR